VYRECHIPKKEVTSAFGAVPAILSPKTRR
jgi:hypothetical protein